MKKILFVSAFVLSFSMVFAQKQAWQWYFGYNSSMEFSTGVPVVTTNSAMSQWEGCASIADADGNLLFYTDGLSVWNMNHVVMPNGTGLLGDASSTQSALIVPKPGSNSIYYIFTTGAYNPYAYYSELDLTLQGGLGDITANKNILVSNNSAEKLAGVHAANGDDIWVAIHQNNNAVFQAFLVTSAGVNLTAVVSTVGNPLNGNIGQLQFSPDGKRAAMGSFSSPLNQTVDLFDFDDSTGTFSNHIGLATSYFQTYGLEFAPNSQILYSGANPDNQVHQWDLSSGDQATILASNTIVGSDFNTVGSFQLAPDGKIYVAKESSTYIGVINNPDSLGLGCDYVSLAVNFSPHSVGLGLPNFLASFFSPLLPQPGLFASDTIICEKFCVDYFDQSTNNPTDWLWTFEEGSPPTSTLQNPEQVCYNVPGVYDVTLTASNANGSLTQTFPDYITVYATPPFPTITLAGYTLTSSPASSYQWQLNSVDIPGATNQSYTMLQSGYYTVIVADLNGCKNSASVKVFLSGIEDVTANANISIYPNPSSGSFTVELLNEQGAGEVSIDVWNTLGQKVFTSSEKIPNSGWKKEIDLCGGTACGPAAGVYFIEIKNREFYHKKKIIIMK